MDEGAGLRCFDSSRLQRYGTLSGTTKPAWQVGPKGRCLYFGGAGYVVTPSFGLSGTVVWFSADVRCKFNATTYQTFISDNGQANSPGYLWATRGSNSDGLQWRYAYTSNRDAATALNYFSSPFDDVWLKLLVVCDYNGAKCYFYRNGSLFTTINLTSTPLFPSTARVKYIGYFNAGSDYPLTAGYLANVKLGALPSMPSLSAMSQNAMQMRQGLWPTW